MLVGGATLSESHPIRGDSAHKHTHIRSRLVELGKSLGAAVTTSGTPVAVSHFFLLARVDPATAPVLFGILCVLVGVRPRVPGSRAAA